MIICIEVPIPSYTRKEIFYNHLYFEVDQGKHLTQGAVLKYLKNRGIDRADHVFVSEELDDTIHAVGQVEDWKFVGENGVSSINTFITTKFGIQPFTWSLINPVFIPQMDTTTNTLV